MIRYICWGCCGVENFTNSNPNSPIISKVLVFYHALKGVVCFGLIKVLWTLNAIKNATVNILEVLMQAKSFTDFAAQRIAILSNSLALKELPHLKTSRFKES